MADKSKALSAIDDQFKAATTYEQHLKLLSPEVVNANKDMIIEEVGAQLKKDLEPIFHKFIHGIIDNDLDNCHGLTEIDLDNHNWCPNCGANAKLVTVKKGKNKGIRYRCCSRSKKSGCRVIEYI